MSKTSRRTAILVALILVFLAGPARGDQEADRTLSPYFHVDGDSLVAEAFPLESTSVDVAINGVIASVVVTQIYVNEGIEPINARYVFPGSTRASVHGMRIKIGDQAVVAKIQEKKEAERTFETAKAQGKSASLLKQHRPNVFTMSVANIMPGDRVEVELRYTELLVPVDGTYRFVYPTVVAPRYSNQPGATAQAEQRWVESPYLPGKSERRPSFDIEIALATGLPLQEASCPSHETAITWEDDSRATVSLMTPGGHEGNRDFILEYRLAGQQIQTGLLLHRGETENFFLMMLQPPERVPAAVVLPREYVFVLDVSGSMEGFPLDTAKMVIRDLIGRLRETDMFNVVLFAGGSSVMAPESLPATAENIEKAIWVIERQRGGGGTELAPALQQALSLPRREDVSRAVVVVTDGFIDAERRVFEIIGKSLSKTNFFCFGIGTSVNRYLVEGIARAGMGEPFVVTSPEEAARAASDFRQYVESPILMDIEVQFNGFDAYEVEPSVLPDLFARRPIIVFGKWRGEIAGEIEVSGRGSEGVDSRVLRVDEVEPLGQDSALPYLWARERIARLSDYGPSDPGRDAAEQITSLGLKYSLLTRYTAFVAVIEQVRNTEAAANDVDQPLPLAEGLSSLAVGGVYVSGPEPELWLLSVLILLMAPLVALRRRGGLTGGGSR